MAPPVLADPPPIPGVRRSFVEARGVRFHVTEAGAGTPVLVLHGWPEHHYCYRELLAAPPSGMRIIAPDLPGYGWSGPAPHRWAKQDVADDVLALLGALEIPRAVLVGHDWGGWIGYLLALGAPDRFSALLSLAIPHIWNGPRQLGPHLWRLMHMPPMALAGRRLMSSTPVLERAIFRLGVADRTAFPPSEVHWYADRFRDPVCAQVTTDTYRTFLTRELPAAARAPERRRATVPIRALLGAADFAVHPSLGARATAQANDYEMELVPGAGHFLAEERAPLVRERLVSLVAAHRP